MKKNIIVLIIAFIVSVATTLFVLKSPPLINENTNNATITDKQTGEIAFVIDNGTDPKITSKVEFREGMTAYDALKIAAENADLLIKTKNYDIGILIKAIGEKKNGDDQKYWLYYINGSAPTIAADKQSLKPGDTVEFRFEKSPY